jgi:hypothetical protein
MVRVVVGAYWSSKLHHILTSDACQTWEAQAPDHSSSIRTVGTSGGCEPFCCSSSYQYYQQMSSLEVSQGSFCEARQSRAPLVWRSHYTTLQYGMVLYISIIISNGVVVMLCYVMARHYDRHALLVHCVVVKLY